MRHGKLSHPNFHGESSQIDVASSSTARSKPSQVQHVLPESSRSSAATLSTHANPPLNGVSQSLTSNDHGTSTKELQNNPQVLSNEPLSSLAQLFPSPDNTQPQEYAGDNVLQYAAHSAVGTSNNLDFLLDWDWDRGVDDFLPTTFYDTKHSLSDLWRTETLHFGTSTISASDPRTCNTSAQNTLVSEQAMTLRPLCERLPPLEPDFELSNNERIPIQELGSGPNTDAQQPLPPTHLGISRFKPTLLSVMDSTPTVLFLLQNSQSHLDVHSRASSRHIFRNFINIIPFFTYRQ